MQLQYFPNIFDAPNIEAAKAIILTDEGPGADTNTRWQIETPYVLELIGQHIALNPGMLVLDYGCGIGRLAKAMIEASGCRVIGVDISENMRILAERHVNDPHFLAVSPGQFDTLVASGLRVGGVISVWVLQHCARPDEDIARITSALAPGAHGFVLNMKTRAVPAVPIDDQADKLFRWVSDDIDVAHLLRKALPIMAEGEPDSTRTPNMADAGAFWMGF